MATGINLLNVREVKTATGPARLRDGGGLCLDVNASGAKRWLFIFRFEGKRPEMGLGSAGDRPGEVGLAAARKARDAALELVAAGINPIAARKAPAPAPDVVVTFGEAALDLIASLTPGWKNPKTAKQWENSLRTHAAAVWAMPVREVALADVLATLKPIWSAKAETAARVRERMERVLGAAKVRGLRTGDNPAAWKENLAELLPRLRGLQRGHFTALPYQDVPAFLATLRERLALSAKALEFTILTASRTKPVRLARWPEIDRTARVWVCPAEHMKSGLEHRVPLSPRALAILDAVAQEFGTEGFIFPGQVDGKPLSDGALERVLDRMDVAVTVHGFRASFRGWVGEATAYPRELAEMALAHAVGDQTERSYWRSDALERRRPLMEAWADFCDRPVGSNVKPLRGPADDVLGVEVGH